MKGNIFSFRFPGVVIMWEGHYYIRVEKPISDQIRNEFPIINKGEKQPLKIYLNRLGEKTVKFRSEIMDRSKIFPNRNQSQHITDCYFSIPMNIAFDHRLKEGDKYTVIREKG